MLRSALVIFIGFSSLAASAAPLKFPLRMSCAGMVSLIDVRGAQMRATRYVTGDQLLTVTATNEPATLAVKWRLDEGANALGARPEQLAGWQLYLKYNRNGLVASLDTDGSRARGGFPACSLGTHLPELNPSCTTSYTDEDGVIHESTFICSPAQ